MSAAAPQPRAPRSRRPTQGSRPRGAWLVVGIALLAANLRPAVVAVSPLTPRIRAATGLTAAGVSLLTTLPLVCFGLFASLAPRLGRRIGLERALAVAVSALLAGILLRLVPGRVPLFLGSALVGAGISNENVLLPSLVKRDFPRRAGVMMGLYSLMLSGGASAAAGLTLPLGDAAGGGWRVPLALWGVLAAAALVAWLPFAARGRTRRATGSSAAPSAARPGGGEPDEGEAPASGLTRATWRAPLAWWVAGYMAGQSFVFYSLNAWLPSLLESHGISPTTAGAMLALFNFTGIATSSTTPLIAVRLRNQRPLAGLVAGAFAAGLVGLLLAPAGGAWAWMVLLGIAQGAGISLGLTLFVLRTRTAPAAAELSGMAQTVGYLVAALGPLTVGALHGATGGWTPGLIELLAVSAWVLLAGWTAGSARTLATEPG